MLFGWGDGSYGQLGSSEEEASQPVPLGRDAPAVGGQEVVLVACGERHTLLLLADGSLASCGDNAQGQLGRKLPAGRQRCYLPGRNGQGKFRPSRPFPNGLLFTHLAWFSPRWPFKSRCGFVQVWLVKGRGFVEPHRQLHAKPLRSANSGSAAIRFSHPTPPHPRPV